MHWNEVDLIRTRPWICVWRRVCSQVQGHSVHSDAPVLHAEVVVLLEKDAIKPVPLAEMKSGFYSPYFIVPKKGDWLRSILDLHILNRALHNLLFRKLTQRRIFKCIRPFDWFAAFDLKDFYFHVSILPRHRPFLSFAFEGRAYQYKALPLRLSLSPRGFTLHQGCRGSPCPIKGSRHSHSQQPWRMAHTGPVSSTVMHPRPDLCNLYVWSLDGTRRF